MTPAGFLDVCVTIGIVLVLAAVLFAFARIAKGPSFSDRVVALDMMTISIVAFCALVSVRAGTSAFLDVGIVLALIGFLATVALARFAERGLHLRRDTTDKPGARIQPIRRNAEAPMSEENGK